MSDEPITDAPQPSDEQDAPAQERPPREEEQERGRPSQAEGEDDEA